MRSMSKRTAILFWLLGLPCIAARIDQASASGFDRYIAQTEARIGKTLRPVPAVSDSIEPVDGGTRDIGGALIHHWRATAIVPGATPNGMIALLRDYKGLPVHYAPQVVSATVLADSGSNARILVRFKEQKVITIVLDAEYQIESDLAGDHGHSFSRSRHIWEIDNPGERNESRRREGDDDGYLWRLNSYWTFERVASGLMIQCEAVSMTRNVPPALGWLIKPMIQDLPREMLAFTMSATKRALLQETK